jgi:anaerobic selenocysteine-containing dehydrogenase
MGNKPDKGQATSRRGFLKMAGASAPAAIAAVSASGTKAEAATDDQTKSGLQDTAHTRAYFDSAKF